MRHATIQSHQFSRFAVGRGEDRSLRSAFTLVELMVAVTILLVLGTITARVVISTTENDRVPSGSRQVQSSLEGARDRAIYSTKTPNPGPRGIRFIRNPNDPIITEDLNGNGELDQGEDLNNNKILDLNIITVTSMVYIGPPQKYSEGILEIGEKNATTGVIDKRKIRIRNTNPGGNQDYEPDETLWSNLELRKLISDGARIKISGQFYTMINKNPDGYPGKWELTKDFPASKFPSSQDYELELEPAVLPNQEPRLFPRNVVIDINNSRVPPSWKTTKTTFNNRRDILFSPRGMIVGRSAVEGYIHLVLTDLADVELNLYPGHPDKQGGERIVTINTRTGKVTVHPVFPGEDANNDGVFTPNDPVEDANNNGQFDKFNRNEDLNMNGRFDLPNDDPFFYAETGEEL
jgi:prepilin-type N-terminal cleavage/methylation domain-containing protein